MLTEIISLNRSARIRVKTADGSYKNLSTKISRWVDLDEAYNRKNLNSHASIGQWLSTCSADESSDPQEKDWIGVGVRGLHAGARVRVEGYLFSTDEYGLWDLGQLLSEDPSNGVWINLGSYDGNPDPNDGTYNRIQLNHHRAIGQYVQSQYTGSAGLKALNRSVKVRIKNSNGDLLTLGTSGYTWLDLTDLRVLESLNHHSAIGQWVVSEFWD